MIFAGLVLRKRYFPNYVFFFERLLRRWTTRTRRGNVRWARIGRSNGNRDVGLGSTASSTRRRSNSRPTTSTASVTSNGRRNSVSGVKITCKCCNNRSATATCRSRFDRPRFRPKTPRTRRSLRGSDGRAANGSGTVPKPYCAGWRVWRPDGGNRETATASSSVRHRYREPRSIAFYKLLFELSPRQVWFESRKPCLKPVTLKSRTLTFRSNIRIIFIFFVCYHYRNEVHSIKYRPSPFGNACDTFRNVIDFPRRRSASLVWRFSINVPLPFL